MMEEAYGEEWVNEMKGLNKNDLIIIFLKPALIRANMLEQELTERDLHEQR